MTVLDAMSITRKKTLEMKEGFLTDEEKGF